MIKCIIFDIDGVITDGKISVDANGIERKNVNLKDIDSIYLLKEKYPIVAITGENSEKSKYFKEKIPWNMFFADKKNKLEVIKEIENELTIDRDEICYVGDGKYDIDALNYVGLSICPKDAIEKAKEASKYILSKNAGDGGLEEILKYIQIYDNKNEFEIMFSNRLNNHIDIFRQILRNEKLINRIDNISKIIVNAIKNNNKVYIFGNGGSAADAQHIAAEFVGRFKFERQAMNVEALTTNSSILTAIGNDYSFNKIFTRQLEAKVNKGDITIGISTSGNSNNVIEALKYAKTKHAISIILTGSNVNEETLKDYCDYIINVPSIDTPRIQEAHIFIGHIIAEYVEKQIVESDVEQNEPNK